MSLARVPSTGTFHPMPGNPRLKWIPLWNFNQNKEGQFTKSLRTIVLEERHQLLASGFALMALLSYVSNASAQPSHKHYIGRIN